jgi:hypothetical protein
VQNVRDGGNANARVAGDVMSASSRQRLPGSLVESIPYEFHFSRLRVVHAPEHSRGFYGFNPFAA